MIYEDYKKNGGALTEKEFQALESKVSRLLSSYAKSLIPHWRYELLNEVDMSEAIIDEIDFINAHGGDDVFNGQSDYTITSVNVSAFNYKIDTSNIEFYKGIPLSATAVMCIYDALRENGLLSRRFI